MLFFTFEPYDLNKILDTDEKEKMEECFICYEITICEDIEPIKLEKQQYYLKTCKCIGFIHKKCLEKWFNRTQKCPVCREQIVENFSLAKNISFLTSYFIPFYFFYKKNIFIITQFCLIIIIFYFIIDSYYSILINRFINVNSYDSYNPYYPNYPNYNIETFEPLPLRMLKPYNNFHFTNDNKINKLTRLTRIVHDKGFFIDNINEENTCFNISSIIS